MQTIYYLRNVRHCNMNNNKIEYEFKTGFKSKFNRFDKRNSQMWKKKTYLMRKIIISTIFTAPWEYELWFTIWAGVKFENEILVIEVTDYLKFQWKQIVRIGIFNSCVIRWLYYYDINWGGQSILQTTRIRVDVAEKIYFISVYVSFLQNNRCHNSVSFILYISKRFILQLFFFISIITNFIVVAHV